jgi:hypothetical protein
MRGRFQKKPDSLARMKKMTKKQLALCGIFFVLALATSACVPGDGSSSHGNPAGFFSGIWHGWIAPISLIIGFFNRSIRVYEVYNTGWWYDLGFYAAIISGFGGFSLVRRKKEGSN